MSELKADLKKQILELMAQYYEVAHSPKAFVPGQSAVPPSGRVFGPKELQNLAEATLDFWLTTGRFNSAFERNLQNFIGVKHALTVNSGSSANLLAFASLTADGLKDRALRPGDEVITVAAGFPTTVNPSLLYGMVPVFVDVEIPTYNIRADLIESAVTPRTRAIMIAHTLGNPFNLDEVMRVAKKHNLWVIEDCCDALGSRYDGKLVGTFGNVGTLSFYPAHHITMGEGGAVFTNDQELATLLESIRDWGRDCYCQPGKDNTCGKRFEWQLGQLPHGYDHKYIYSNLGFNLKITDMQASVGLAQLERLPAFVEARKKNFKYLRSQLEDLQEFLILPEATPKSDPSWFGFPITLRPESKKTRADLQRALAQKKVGSRLLFAGNLAKQPYFQGRKYRVHGSLENTDTIMNQTLWVGIYPGLSESMLDYAAASFREFFKA